MSVTVISVPTDAHKCDLPPISPEWPVGTEVRCDSCGVHWVMGAPDLCSDEPFWHYKMGVVRS